MPFTKSMSDFEIERVERPADKRLSYGGTTSRALMRRNSPDYNSEAMYQNSVAKLITAKAHPFSISGHIPLDPSALTVFFRSQVCGLLRILLWNPTLTGH